jgi:O-antigen ligase
LYGVFISGKVFRIISLLNCIIVFITIIILQSVSVFLGLAVSFIVILIFLLRNREAETNKKKQLGYFFLFFLLIAAAIFIYSKTTNFKELQVRIQTMERYITEPSSMNDVSLENNNSTYERIILWRNSLRMIREHPVLGSGLSNWTIYFPKYGVGSAPYMNSGMIRFERPHNDFLFIWCETGVIGFLSYIALLVISIIYCRRILQHSIDAKTKWLAVLMMTGIFSFIIISCFGFPQQRPFTMIFLMTTLAVIQSKFIAQNNSATSVVKMNVSRIFFISGIAISLLSFYVGMKRVMAEAHLSDALTAQVKKDWNRMARESSLAQSYFFPVDYNSTPVKWYMGFG